MTDNDVINFDYDPSDKPIDIVQCMRDMISRAFEWQEIEQARLRDPNWEWQPVHICSRSIAEIMLADDTPLEVKRGLEWATYSGHHWAWVGKEKL